MKCIKCGAPISKKEWQEQYGELTAGVKATMEFFCKVCHDRVVETVKWQLTKAKGSIQ